MGNSLLKNYDVERGNPSSGGVGMSWQIFPAKERKTGKDVSVFIAMKRNLPRGLRTEEFWEKTIKKDAGFLTRLRHPHVLDVKRAPVDERGIKDTHNSSVSNK
eukprot:1394941-Amorphochlora_amoeboformis.AAC.2